MLTGRTGWPDPLRWRQESPGIPAPCASGRANVNGQAKEAFFLVTVPEDRPGSGFSRLCQQSRRGGGASSGLQRVTGLLYFAAVPGAPIFEFYL
jgi:hypothetical protein